MLDISSQKNNREYQITGGLMGFIKHSDGKIMTVLDESELTTDQKKLAKDLSQKTVKQSDQTDTSDLKKSGR
jgi:hypothetical protein